MRLNERMRIIELKYFAQTNYVFSLRPCHSNLMDQLRLSQYTLSFFVAYKGISLCRSDKLMPVPYTNVFVPMQQPSTRGTGRSFVQ